MDFGPVAGSPLLPSGIIALYILVSALFTYLLYRKILQVFPAIFFTQIFFGIIVGSAVAVYLLPSPHVTHTDTKNAIIVEFDRPVSRKTLEKTITPEVPGIWVFENPVYATHLYRRLVFYPTIATYDPNTSYTVTLNTITNIFKTSPPYNLTFTFTTPGSTARFPKTTPTPPPQPPAPPTQTASDIAKQTMKLDVPVYLQQHALSCEVSALRMLLGFRGIAVSEDTLLSQLGTDWTPHQGNIWGNPYEHFVGNVNGRQMVDGYGVYWGPIARVASGYRNAQDFQGWSVSQLTDEIKKGNPIEIWVYASGGYPTSWKTPDGKDIPAYRDEHTVVVVGFVGTQDNPTHIIVHDPLHGEVYWTRSVFDAKWASFGQSGVVIR